MDRVVLQNHLISHAADLRARTAHWPWSLICEATCVFGLFWGVVLGFAYSTGAFSETVAQKNEELKKMGYTVSSSGVAIKTDKRALQQDEIADAMQRGAIKTVASGAVKFRPGAGAGDPAAVLDQGAAPMSRTSSKAAAMSKVGAKVDAQPRGGSLPSTTRTAK